MNRAQRNRAARLARRVLVDGRLVAPLPPEKHGVRSTATNWGCQCEQCSAAASGYWHDYQQAYVSKTARRRAA